MTTTNFIYSDSDRLDVTLRVNALHTRFSIRAFTNDVSEFVKLETRISDLFDITRPVSILAYDSTGKEYQHSVITDYSDIQNPRSYYPTLPSLFDIKKYTFYASGFSHVTNSFEKYLIDVYPDDSWNY